MSPRPGAVALAMTFIPLAAGAETVTLAAGGLTATFDLETGSLTSLDSGRPAVAWASGPAAIRLRVGDAWLQTGNELAFAGAVQRPLPPGEGAVLELTWSDANWTLTDIWQAQPSRRLISRKLEIARTGTEPQELRVRGLQMELGGLRPEAARWVRHGLGLLFDAEAGAGLHSYFDDRDEGVGFDFLEVGGQWSARYSPGLLARMQPGDRQVVGTWVLRGCQGDLLECKAAGKLLYSNLGLLPPAGRPASAASTVIYSLHPGGNIDSWFRCVGGFDNLQSWLAPVRRLGANALWLLPTYTYCVGGRLGDGCPYGPSDFWTQEAALGGDAAARRFVDASHGQDFRVLFDLVPHGGSYVSRERHPNWICRDEEGKPIEWFGAGCDYSAAGYQRDMQDICEHVVRSFGIDGFRVDCAMGGPANWSTEAKRVSASQLSGALGMNAAIRRGFELARPGVPPLTYPEEWESHPAHAPTTDICYGGPFYWFIEGLRKSGRAPEEWGAAIRSWLSDEFWGTPPGTLQGRFITNHDMDRDNGPASLAWGMARSRAMMALCFGIEGAPFVYQEQEVGAGPWYARLAAARRALPELRDVTADYDSVQAEDLFACWRPLEDGGTLVLVNLTPRAGERNVALAPEVLPPGDVPWVAFDALSGEDLPAVAKSPTGFHVQMPAFGARYIALRATKVEAAAAREAAGLDAAPTEVAQVPLVAEAGDDGSLRLTCGKLDLRATVTATEGDPPAHSALAAAGGTLGGAADVSVDLTPEGDDVLLRLTATARRDLRSRSGASLELALTGDSLARWFALAADALWEDWHWQRHFGWADGPGYGFGPGTLHQGRLLADRLFESGVFPLHAEHPWVALADAAGNVVGARVESVGGLPEGFPAPNVYFSDGSSPSLATPGAGFRIALVDRDYPGRPQRGPRVVGLGADDPVWASGATVTLTVRLRGLQVLPADGVAPWGDALLPALTTEPVTWVNPLAGETRMLPGSDGDASRGMAGLIWGAFRTMTYGWRLPVARPGVYDVWIRARNSEVRTEGTDLCDKYSFTVGGKTVEPKWEALGLEKVGENGYVGWMRLGGVTLSAPDTDLRMRTSANWCAVDDRFILSADPGWLPEEVRKARATQ